MIITRTPYRLSFFGGGTDYKPWYEENGGIIVGCSFSQYCYISLRKLPPFFEHKTRIVYSKIEQVNDNRDLVHPSVKGCLEYLQVHEGIEIHHDGDLPARSGIGSSSSFTAGLLLALHTLRNKMVTKRTLAEQAIHVEQEVIKESVGIQDQILVAHGGLQIIEMGPGPRFNVQPLIIPRDYRAEFEKHVLLGFTGQSRTASDVAEGQVNNIKSGKSTGQLSEIHSIAKEGLRSLATCKDMSTIGKLFDQTWQIKRRLSDGVSSDEIDGIYNTAVKAGAYGGRLMGAGGGGFFVFLAPPERHAAIREALNGRIRVWVPFKIDESGAQVLLHNEP